MSMPFYTVALAPLLLTVTLMPLPTLSTSRRFIRTR